MKEETSMNVWKESFLIIQIRFSMRNEDLRKVAGNWTWPETGPHTVLESMRTWLNETTRQSRRDCNEVDGESATCTKDDAWAAANRWRWKVHPHEVDVIEHYCGRVMRLMG